MARPKIRVPVTAPHSRIRNRKARRPKVRLAVVGLTKETRTLDISNLNASELRALLIRRQTERGVNLPELVSSSLATVVEGSKILNRETQVSPKRMMAHIDI